jgi:hypothetical protein
MLANAPSCSSIGQFRIEAIGQTDRFTASSELLIETCGLALLVDRPTQVLVTDSSYDSSCTCRPSDASGYRVPELSGAGLRVRA